MCIVPGCSVITEAGYTFTVTLSTNDTSNAASNISALMSNDVHSDVGFVIITDFSYILDFGKSDVMIEIRLRYG